MNYPIVTLNKMPCRGSTVDVGLPQDVRVVHTTPPNHNPKAMVVEWTVQQRVYQRTYLINVRKDKQS